MKIFCICMMKDEIDIIEQTLIAAADWADAIFVYDTGSKDGSWARVVALAKTYPQIVPYRSELIVFQDPLRGRVFRSFRHLASDGDWWCILDSDEIYIDEPRKFLTSVPPQYQIVWNASFQFYLTDADLMRYEQDPACFADDKPVEDKMRYYRNDWSEARFFKYDQELIWPEGQSFPYAGAIYPKRIRLRHYKHRSPQQLQRRTAARQQAIRSGTTSFLHERGVDDWRGQVRPAAELDFDARDGQFVTRENLMPKLPITARLPPRLVNLARTWKRYVRRTKSRR